MEKIVFHTMVLPCSPPSPRQKYIGELTAWAMQASLELGNEIVKNRFLRCSSLL